MTVDMTPDDATVPMAAASLDEARDTQAFEARLARHFPVLEDLLSRVYRDRPDLSQHLDALRDLCRRAWSQRPHELKQRDGASENNSSWHLSEEVVGATLYVDLFAGHFNGVRARIPYLKALGVNYLHLMPLFRVPEETLTAAMRSVAIESVTRRSGLRKIWVSSSMSCVRRASRSRLTLSSIIPPMSTIGLEQPSPVTLVFSVSTTPMTPGRSLSVMNAPCGRFFLRYDGVHSHGVSR